MESQRIPSSVLKLRQEREEQKRQHQVKAQIMWNLMDKNERLLIRFGMFPAKLMESAESEGFNGKDLAVSLMDCASRNGGMRA